MAISIELHNTSDITVEAYKDSLSSKYTDPVIVNLNTATIPSDYTYLPASEEFSDAYDVLIELMAYSRAYNEARTKAIIAFENSNTGVYSMHKDDEEEFLDEMIELAEELESLFNVFVDNALIVGGNQFDYKVHKTAHLNDYKACVIAANSVCSFEVDIPISYETNQWEMKSFVDGVSNIDSAVCSSEFSGKDSLGLEDIMNTFSSFITEFKDELVSIRSQSVPNPLDINDLYEQTEANLIIKPCGNGYYNIYSSDIDDEDIVNVDIYNVNGQIIKSLTSKNNEFYVENKGVFILRISIKDKIFTRKFINSF